MTDRTDQVEAQARGGDITAFLHLGFTRDTNLEYVGETDVPDVAAYVNDNEEHFLLCPAIEYGRISSESPLTTVSFGDYVEGDARGDWKKYATVLTGFLHDRGIERVTVPAGFPQYLATTLEEEGITVVTGPNLIERARRCKTAEEIEHLEAAQETTERMMKTVEETLREATVEDDTLHHDGSVLTSEELKTRLRKLLLEEGYQMQESIIACGEDSADPHGLGSGPLYAGQPIIVDLFPQASSGYWGDMTRTFFKQHASEKAKQMYSAVKEAQETALETIEAGVPGSKVHQAAKDVFSEHGFETTDGEGFLHRTGHSIGLELHEEPSVNEDCGRLEAGMVLTIEPALYYQDTGGIRIEDMVVVTDDGYRNLNSYEKDLTIC